MGNLCKGGNDAASSNSATIDNELRREKARLDNEVKLLLLGAGESGKSTILKQMKIIHQEGYSHEECMAFKEVIHSNTVQSMKVLINAAHKLGSTFSADMKDAATTCLTAHGDDWNQKIGEAIQLLWENEEIKTAFARRSEFQLNDSAEYFFSHLNRINSPDYIPTQQDVLRSRVRTTGIVETSFTYNGLRFRMFDVGGQRNERRKWIHCFQGVTAVIFCVSLAEYDQTLYEDDTTNRMRESLMLFDEICNSKWFKDTSIILFLNKTDLFDEKIKRVDLKVCFEEYTGGLDSYEEAVKYIMERFVELNRNPDTKQIYPYPTCATDTNNIRNVFTAVKDIILQNNLRQNPVY